MAAQDCPLRIVSCGDRVQQLRRRELDPAGAGTALDLVRHRFRNRRWSGISPAPRAHLSGWRARKSGQRLGTRSGLRIRPREHRGRAPRETPPPPAVMLQPRNTRPAASASGAAAPRHGSRDEARPAKGSCRPSRSRRPRRRRGLRLDIHADGAKGQLALEGAARHRGGRREQCHRLDCHRPWRGIVAPTCVRSAPRSAARKTPSTRLPSGTQPSCIRRSAAADAVLHARINQGRSLRRTATCTPLWWSGRRCHRRRARP